MVHDYGSDFTGKWLSDLQRYFNFWISQYGFGIGPADMVTELSRRYIEIYHQLTGETFAVDNSLPIEQRIAKNLKGYALGT